jgi:predicted nucleotide-binding protein
MNELSQLQKDIAAIGLDENLLPRLDALKRSVQEIAKSWSNSWVGYHSRVYYENFDLPPPGHHFDLNCGLDPTQRFMARKRGPVRWSEFPDDAVKDEIFRRAGISAADLEQVRNASINARTRFTKIKAQICDILRTCLASQNDPALGLILEETEKTTLVSFQDCIDRWQPQKPLVQDRVALLQGIRIAPHISVLAEVEELRSPFAASDMLLSVVERAIAQLERGKSMQTTGTKIFIGHGRSDVWKELKNFLRDKLKLECEEFNENSPAGMTTVERLSKMLDESKFAFLIMTAEDEHNDGTTRARMNVIHEVGLFQGRLGFKKAIILLENGCAEFSNITGLVQIRFPPGNIKDSFEEIRGVLEREEIISRSSPIH